MFGVNGEWILLALSERLLGTYCMAMCDSMAQQATPFLYMTEVVNEVKDCLP